MNFEDCKNPKELYDAIEGNPTYKLMSRDIAYRPEDFRWYRGKGSIPILGITEEIDFEKLQHPKQIYKHAKLCVLRLQSENPALKTGNFSNEEDPLTGLQNIMRWCCKTASDKAEETSGGKTSSRSIDSQNKHEDIVELKPNFCGIGLNINALIRKRKWWIKIKNLLKAFIYR